MRRSRSRGSAANARFAGPVGTDDATARFLDALARMGVDGSGAARVEGGSISVSGIFIDASGEKMVVTQRGTKLDQARPADPAALVADVDVVLADNRFPDFVQPICERRARAAFRWSSMATRRRGSTIRSIALASHVIFSSEGLRATTGLADLGAALAPRVRRPIRAFLAVTNGPEDVLWMEGGALRQHAGVRVSSASTRSAPATRFTAPLRWRWPRAAMRSPPCASAPRRPRSNARASAAFPARPCRAEVEAFLADRTCRLK